MGKVDSRTVGALVELRKEVAELEYKKGYVERNSPSNEELGREVEEELQDARDKLAAVEARISGAGVEIIIPFQCKIDELNEKISKHELKAIDKALKSKEGELFKLLTERGNLLRTNAEHKREVGKLALLLPLFEKSKREALIEMVKEGKVEELELPTTEPKTKALVPVLNRLGLRCKAEDGKLLPSDGDWKEGRVPLNNEHVWVPKEHTDSYILNEKQIHQVGVKLQVKNAEKQVREFGSEEMKEFEDLQNTYLTLLKVRKELVENYESELSDLI